MNRDEAARVLAACALYDYRFGTPNLDVLKAWHDVLHDLDGNLAVEAVRRYYAVHTDRIMPGHVRQGVKVLREEQRRHEPAPPRALPSRFEQDINREVRMAEGAASARQVLGPLLEHIAAKQPEFPSAWDEVLALTAGPSDTDVVDTEVVE